MRRLRLLTLIIWLSQIPGMLQAAEENMILADGYAVKVLFFKPSAVEPSAAKIEPPPLAVLVAGGANSEFTARAQFWMGREMVKRGWAIAVPISAEGRMFFVENPQLVTEIIANLHESHELQSGKTLLVGISSGGSAALAIAAQDPAQYLGVVATPGRILDSSKLRRLDGLPIYLRIGERDNFRWNRGLSKTVDALLAAGASVDAAIVPDQKHIFRLDWENLEAWLQRLQQPAH